MTKFEFCIPTSGKAVTRLRPDPARCLGVASWAAISGRTQVRFALNRLQKNAAHRDLAVWAGNQADTIGSIE
jgi:hypothetical protein